MSVGYLRFLMSVGLICVAVAIVLNRFVGSAPASNFFQGMCTGIAIVVLPFSLFKLGTRKEK